MNGNPFSYDPLEMKNISYAAGQPMGTYSSFCSFAFTHHFILYVCHERAGIKYTNSIEKLNYVILGDDILIRNERVYKEYCKVMASLGVEIHPLKSHESPHFYEFAKRMFFKREEVTPLPMPALFEARKSQLTIVPLILSEERKGVTPQITTVVAVSKFLKLSRITNFSGKLCEFPEIVRQRLKEPALNGDLKDSMKT
jgi:hypothetical protein